MVVADLAILGVNRDMLDSMHSSHTIRRERPRLRIKEAGCNRLFEMLAAEDDSAPYQHGDHA